MTICPYNRVRVTPNGTQKWTFVTQSKMTSAPAVAQDGTIYFGSQDTNLYALDPSGHKKWSYKTGGAVYSAPTLDADGVIIFGTWQSNLIALDPLDGSVNWTRAISSALYDSPLIGANGSVYALGTDYSITKFVGPTNPEPSSLAVLGGASLRRRTWRAKTHQAHLWRGVRGIGPATFVAGPMPYLRNYKKRLHLSAWRTGILSALACGRISCVL